MRTFGCPVTILNSLDPLGKFNGKAEEGFLVGYFVNSKAFRVFNSQTRKVEENLHVNFLKNKPNVTRQGPNWLFNIDSLTNSMNYQPVTAGNQTNKNVGPQEDYGNTEPRKIAQALDDESWVEAMQEELLQFKIQKIKRGIVVRNKARLVAQGYKQEDVIDYDEVFAPVARIKVSRLFLAYASFMNFLVYQMDVKSAFLYGTIEEEYKDISTPIETNKLWTYIKMVRMLMSIYIVKRIFRYLKGRPNLGLWYPKDSPFILEAFSDSDYAGASLDRKSTKQGGCQFLGSSAICVVKNPVYHSKTKHIEIRHHFIRDSYEKRLIEMVKIYIDNNVADVLTKAFNFLTFIHGLCIDMDPHEFSLVYLVVDLTP
ncbi:retrovirus-related pol polyprotein from transposon TNT 1-94 [Tanacetum coccineum]